MIRNHVFPSASPVEPMVEPVMEAAGIEPAQDAPGRAWHHGKLLFASIVVLGAVPLFSLELGRYALGVLGLISVLACLPVHRQRQNLGVAPKRDGVKSRGRA